jgi:hypothetical protein
MNLRERGYFIDEAEANYVSGRSSLPWQQGITVG